MILHGYIAHWEWIESRRYWTARVPAATLLQVPPPAGVEQTVYGVRILSIRRDAPAYNVLEQYLARCRQAEEPEDHRWQNLAEGLMGGERP